MMIFAEIRKAMPSSAQAEAGNYKKRHIRLDGMDISIENPKGSIRRGTSPDGKAWERRLTQHYGYIRGTKGHDKDHVDVFIRPGTRTSPKVFVVNQNKASGGFDENKVLMGFDSEAEARKAYLSNYQKCWKGLGSIVELTLPDFKTWVFSNKPSLGPLEIKKAMVLYLDLIKGVKLKDRPGLTLIQTQRGRRWKRMTPRAGAGEPRRGQAVTEIKYGDSPFDWFPSRFEIIQLYPELNKPGHDVRENVKEKAVEILGKELGWDAAKAQVAVKAITHYVEVVPGALLLNGSTCFKSYYKGKIDEYPPILKTLAEAYPERSGGVKAEEERNQLIYDGMVMKLFGQDWKAGLKKEADVLAELVDAIKVSFEGTVFNASRISPESRGWKMGSTIEFNTVMSFSAKPDKVKKFGDWMVKVKNPKHAAGIKNLVSVFSSGYSDEEEVLINKGARFKVEEINEKSKIISLTALDGEDVDIKKAISQHKLLALGRKWRGNKFEMEIDDCKVIK